MRTRQKSVELNDTFRSNALAVPGTILIRADASIAVGTGHVMRCLALAQEWRHKGGSAVFAMSQVTPAVKELLQRESVGVVQVTAELGSADDAREAVAFARENEAFWVVVDGYSFGAEYQEALKVAGLKVLFIDDNGHAAPYSADLVLNQNAYADEALYPRRDASTRLLLGPRFALLRHEFVEWRGWEREIPTVARRVLVTMGGSDPDNLTQKVVEAILPEGDFEITIIAGGSNPHLAELRQLVSNSGHALRLLENASNMPELMANADVAVAGAGTTTWEMCFLGLPALLIVLADNQQGVADELRKQGIVVHLGRGSDLARSILATQLRSLAGSPAVRREMSQHGRALVDGRGAERVVRAMNRDTLSIRLAEAGDCKLLWEWANDPVVRASAFSSKTIPWEEHVAWFREKLDDPDCRILVALDASAVPMGQIRFNKRGVREADVDIIVDSHLRGLGYGSHLIDLGANWAFSEWDLMRLNAFVKPENVASANAFERADFQPKGAVTVKGQSATHYVRTAK
jgi:UDP-2,4-diacetamido-2,4,6-trideoxy-beta-L-altropyranose hydrolase